MSPHGCALGVRSSEVERLDWQVGPVYMVGMRDVGGAVRPVNDRYMLLVARFSDRCTLCEAILKDASRVDGELCVLDLNLFGYFDCDFWCSDV